MNNIDQSQACYTGQPIRCLYAYYHGNNEPITEQLTKQHQHQPETIIKGDLRLAEAIPRVLRRRRTDTGLS